jgi:hypothetical protein
LTLFFIFVLLAGFSPAAVTLSLGENTVSKGRTKTGILLLAQNDAQTDRPPFGRPQRPEDEAREKMEKDMAKRRNLERQQDIKRDSDKLLKLATELKEYVDKSNENILSIEVVKKADEIEKYAHSVKEKMKTSQ